MTTDQLITKCQKGDAKAQELLFNQYKDALFTLAVRLSSSYEEAEDVFIEGFAEIFDNIKSFQGKSTIGAWMKTIISRKAYSHFKKKRPFISLEESHENAVIDWGESIDIEKLEIALKQLPDGYRIVLVMIEIEGFKHREVAEQLGISVGTSKSQLYHAKRQLKENLERL